LRDIPGYPGYAATDEGLIFSRLSNKILIGGLDTCGYRRYCLQIDGRQLTAKGHRLVALAYHPNPDGLPCVNHKNGVRGDNRPSNLEWITQKGNVIHAARAGNMSRIMPIGEKHHNSKLTDRERACIVNLKGKLSQRELATIFNIDQSVVSRLQMAKLDLTENQSVDTRTVDQSKL